MVNWNDLAAEGKAEKEEELNKNLMTALKGVATELDELFESPDLSIVDKTRIAEHFRDSMMRFKAGGTRLSLGSTDSAPAPAADPSPAPESSATPTATPAESKRLKELEDALAKFISDTTGAPAIRGADGKLNHEVGFAAIKRAHESDVQKAVDKATREASKGDKFVLKSEVHTQLDVAATALQNTRASRINGDTHQVIKSEELDKAKGALRDIAVMVAPSA